MGNSHSIEALLEHSHWVGRLARALVGSGDADDLVQDTYAVALRRPEAMNSPRAWLGAVARKLAQNRQRAQRHRGDRERMIAAERPEATTGRLSPASVAERSEIQRSVVDAVHGLPEPYRDVMLMRYFDGLSAAEIAEARGMNPATVRTHLARGRAAVREALDAQSGGDRREWVLALTPMLKAPRTTSVVSAGGAVSSFAFWKVAVAVAALLASTAWWMLSQPEGLPIPGIEQHQVAVAEPEEQSAAPSVAMMTAAFVPASTRNAVPVAVEPAAVLDESNGPLIVLDGRTKQPIPNYQIECVMPVAEEGESDAALGEEMTECLETDSEGRVTIPLVVRMVAPLKRFKTSTHVTKLMGQGGTGYDEPIRVKWVDGRATVEAPSYATVPVKLNLPRGVLSTDLIASVITKGGALNGNLKSEVRQVRTGSFLRFGDRFAAHADDLEMCLVSADGRHFASAPYGPYRMGEKTWDVEWKEHGSVRLRIKRDGETVTKWSMRIELWPGAVRLDADGQVVPADGRSEQPRARRRYLYRGVERGVFELTAMPPGTYTVTLHDRFSNPWAKIIEVEPGQVQDIAAELIPCTGELGSVKGRVTSATGSFNGPVLAYAYDNRPLRGRGIPTSAEVAWAEVNGVQIGTFELKDVALDAHSIGFFRSDDVYDETPMGDLLLQEQYQVPRGETLHIHLSDERAQVTVKVKARDAVTKEPIELFRVDAIREEDTARGLAEQLVDADGSHGVAELDSLTVPEAYGLHVHAPGYQFLMLKPGVLEDRTELTVDLKPGWTGMLGALSTGGEPLEGVEFFVDGVSVGKQLGPSEAKGLWDADYLFGSMPIVRSDVPPKRIEARKEGWVLTGNEPTDEQGQLSSHAAIRGGQLYWIMKKAPPK